MKSMINEAAILHQPESEYCFATSKNNIVLRLRTAKDECFNRVEVIFGCKYDFAFKRKVSLMQKTFTDKLFDYYTVSLNLDDVRLAYVFKITKGRKSYFFSESGITNDYDFNLGYYDFFQVAYINETDVHKRVDWLSGATFYQIFIDRFSRGNFSKDDSYINLKWGEIPNPKSFAGGDIAGIIGKLNYIANIGINALYLTPVFKSVSNHKYDISDYYAVDEQFGSIQELKQLVHSAHNRGIKVVLDAVFNHCSENLLQFQDCLKNGKNSKFYDWFIIDGEKINEQRSNYECFAACTYMPKFNTSNEDVQKFLIEIACSYIRDYHIDGWRLDVSDEVSHDFWRKFRKAVKAINPQACIIGENWHDANAWLQGDQYDSIMNYSFTKACLDYFAFDKFNAQEFSDRLTFILMRNTDQVNYMMMNLLGSHDTDRFLTRVNGDKDKMLAAVAVMVMFVGSSMLYYGDEICMEGGYDPDCRRCFDWENNQHDYSEKIIKLIKLKSLPQLQTGGIRLYALNGTFCLERFIGNSIIRLVVNNTDCDKSISAGGEICFNRYIKGVLEGILEPQGYVIQEIAE